MEYWCSHDNPRPKYLCSLLSCGRTDAQVPCFSHSCFHSVCPAVTKINIEYVEHSSEYQTNVPFSILIQNWCNCSSIGANWSGSNTAVLLQNDGPIVPNRVGQTPWMVHISLGDGNKHEWSGFWSFHSMQVVTGHCCVKINTSKGWSLRNQIHNKRNTDLYFYKINKTSLWFPYTPLTKTFPFIHWTFCVYVNPNTESVQYLSCATTDWAFCL